MVPLTDMIKGKESGAIKLGKEQEKSFEDVKRVLCQEMVLHTPDFSIPFVLQVNALRQVIGTVSENQGG